MRPVPRAWKNAKFDFSRAQNCMKPSVVMAASELYEIICSYGCIRIKINDQGRESVNGVMTKLHEMTGVDQ